MTRGLAALVAIAFAPLLSGDAHADEGECDPDAPLFAPQAASPTFALPLRPIGRWASPGHGRRAATRGGWLLGVDTGFAVAPTEFSDPAMHAWTIGVRGGYEFRNGLAMQLRYDYLGLAPHVTDPPAGPAQLGTVGLRYSLPFVFPLPFIEAMIGPAFGGGSASNVTGAAGFGLGFSIPIGGVVRIDLAGRDWLLVLDEHVHQVLAFELGAGFTIGGARR